MLPPQIMGTSLEWAWVITPVTEYVATCVKCPHDIIFTCALRILLHPLKFSISAVPPGVPAGTGLTGFSPFSRHVAQPYRRIIAGMGLELFRALPRLYLPITLPVYPAGSFHRVH